MSTKVISVLCEGPHDVSFLIKLIRVIGFKMCEGTKLKDFPSPMNHFLVTEATKANIEELKLSEINHALLPSGVLKNKEETIFFFLYALGGDSRKDKREKILTTLMDSIPRAGEYTEQLVDTETSLAYFLDADEKGITTRLVELTEEIQTVLSSKEPSISTNGDVISFNGLQIGGYVFAREGENLGRLEDIMLPMMKQNNEKIFDDAEKYIDAHLDSKRVKKGNFKKDKATIGIAGQLQRSGTSNNVIINHSDYITKDKIENHNRCKEIITFFKQFT